MEFYEYWHDQNSSTICTDKGDRFYPAHYHSNVEIYVCVKGKQILTINGVSYPVKSGQAAIIDSYAIHSYDISCLNPEDYVIITPPLALDMLKRQKGDLRIANPIIDDEKLVEEFAHICQFAFLPVSSKEIAAVATDYLLSLAFTKLELTNEKCLNDETLMHQILEYIDKNFKEKISLSRLAKDLGYSREYLSRVFHHYMKRGLNEYINERRLRYIATTAQAGKKTEIALEAGFSSMQTYYRALMHHRQRNQSKENVSKKKQDTAKEETNRPL